MADKQTLKPTGRHSEIEITPEMIEAGTRELLRFDPNYTTAREGAERLLIAALSAGHLL